MYFIFQETLISACFQVNGATLKQVEKLKYLGVTFTSDRRQDKELKTGICKANAVTWALHYSVVMKWELLKKTKVSIFKTIFIPILNYDHESWEMTKRVRSQAQASEMRLCSVFTKNWRSLHYLTSCVALRFENLDTSSRYFSKLIDLSLDLGLAT